MMLKLISDRATSKILTFLNKPSAAVLASPEPTAFFGPQSAPESMNPSGLPGPLNEPSVPESPILKLPNELLYRIAAFVPKDPALTDDEDGACLFSRLVLVSRTFNRVYTPLLYRNLYLSTYEQLFGYYCNSQRMNTSYHTTSLTIATNALVKYSTPPGGEAWTQILSPLTKMQNLQVLVIHRSGGLHDFPHSRPALDCLASWATKSEFLPNLSTLKVPYYPSLLTLCTGRSIQTVSLGPNVTHISNEAFEEHILHLGSGARPVETLSLYWPADAAVESFEGRTNRIVSLCPELRALEMRLPKKFANFTGWNGNNFDTVFTGWAQKTFASLSRLTHLTLHVSQPQEIQSSKQQATVEAISSILPNLIYIVLPAVQCEWSRRPECDSFTGWSPRPNLGFNSMEWWLDFLELDGAAHVGYEIYMTRNGYINGYPHKFSERLDKEFGRTAFCEDVTRVTEMMRKYWDEDCIPSSKEIEDALLWRARKLSNMYTLVSDSGAYDYMDAPL